MSNKRGYPGIYTPDIPEKGGVVVGTTTKTDGGLFSAFRKHR